jgi:hypothetical protein
VANFQKILRYSKAILTLQCSRLEKIFLCNVSNDLILQCGQFSGLADSNFALPRSGGEQERRREVEVPRVRRNRHKVQENEQRHFRESTDTNLRPLSSFITTTLALK